MSTKVKRKVTVESTKESSDHPRRPSVFDRLGVGAVNVPPQTQDRSSRIDQNEKCRNWLRTGDCAYGNACRFQHETFPTSSRRPKTQKDIDDKDLRYKMRSKRDETKGSRTGSLSPKRKDSKRSRSRSRKGEHDGKIKSTVVVTRPRSPALAESSEKDKKKADGSWEDDSDDWPMDATQLDYKEELTLERKRQQLQRELELELQKEEMMKGKTSYSESSSTSSSSDSGSISSSSGSTSSSSDEDSDESSSSSSSTSSSASQTPVKKKYKKPQSKKEPVRDSVSYRKPLDDYDKIKSNRVAKSNWRPSPTSSEVSTKKTRDRRNVSPTPNFSPKRGTYDSSLKVPNIQTGRKGPRTPSPPMVRKQRQWAQSSSTDSRSADPRKNRSKKHKKKKDGARADRNRMDYMPTPPPLSSPNRTALQSSLGKKIRQRDDSGMKSHHRPREQSPLLLSRIAGSSNSPSVRHGGHYSEMDRFSEKQGQLKSHGRKPDDVTQSHSRKVNSKEQSSKHQRFSPPNKDSRRLSISPAHDKYDNLPKRMYSPLPSFDKDDNRRRNSLSPVRRGKDGKDRRKVQNDLDKRRGPSPQSHDNRRENQYRANEGHRKDESRETKKGRDDKIKNRAPKERIIDHDSWSDEPKKNIRVSDSRRPIDPPISQSTRDDRTRDRKKGKDRDTLLHSVDDLDRDRQRSSPTIGRVPPDLHPHHVLREDVPRGRLYEPEIPPDDREYSYSYVPHREPVYIVDNALPPEYESDLRVAPLYPLPEPVDYPPPVYPDSRYRRDAALKAVASVPHIERIATYSARDISPLGPRDPVGLPVREEDYLADLPIDDRRPYDERWSRNRPMRDDWDSYAPLPPALPHALPPPHAVAELDEDRYGMPRRRRASPEWIMRRGEERDIIREPRSRSPQHRRGGEDSNAPTRGAWGDQHGDRHSSRTNDTRQDNQQKTSSGQDDRKNRNNRRDRRDRNKRTDDSSSDTKPSFSKEKPSIKRPHSPSPVSRKDVKKRKEETNATESHSTDSKSSSNKKQREESKTESRPSSSSSRKVKSEPDSPIVEAPLKVEKEKSEALEKSSATKNPTKHEGDEKRKSNSGKKKSSDTSTRSIFDKKQKSHKNGQSRTTRGKAPGDDDFSDWSDGDDDLLNRDDFTEVSHRRGNSLRSESNSGERSRSKPDESKKEKASKSTDSSISKESEHKPKRDSLKDTRIRANELKSESRSRTTSKERDLERLMNYSRKSTDTGDRSRSQSNSKKTSTESSFGKGSSTQSQNVKDSSAHEPAVQKKEKANTEEFISTENDDYDPISDEELEALIEEPDDSLAKADGTEELKIVDALDINWSTLMNDSKPDIESSKARNRFKAAHVLSRIGFSQSLAGSALSEKITQFCQKQLDDEKDDENQDASSSNGNASGATKKFVMEHPIASFHVSLTQKKKERQEIFNRIGPSRRALCARQDLRIRKLLCSSSTSLAQSPSCMQQYSGADAETNGKSPELKKIGCPTPIVNAAC